MNYVKSEKNAVIICYKLTPLVFFNKEMSENRWKSMKIASIDREFLHNFWMTWRTSKNLSGKMWFIIILKVTKHQGFTLSLENTVFEKSQGEGGFWPPSTQPF